MLVHNFNMIPFLNMPNENSLIHSSWYYKPGILSPTKVQHLLSMTHQTVPFRTPTHDLISFVDGSVVLSFVPDSYALVIWTRSHHHSSRGVTNNISISISFWKAIKDFKVVVVWMKRTVVMYHLPDFDASLVAFSLFLEELFVIWTCRG